MSNGKRPHRRTSCDPSKRRMHSSAVCARQTHWPCVASLQRAGGSPLFKSAPYRGGSGPHLYCLGSSLDAHELSRQTACRSVQPFFSQLTCVLNTHTDRQTTLCATSVATGRISCAASGRCSLKNFNSACLQW